MKAILMGFEFLYDDDGSVIVCALCRNPLARGMTIVVYPASLFREFLNATDRSVPDLDDGPVAVCRPCSLDVDATDVKVH